MHTPGPWTIEDPIEGDQWIVQAGKPPYEWRSIATIPDGDLDDGFPQEVVNANARLIAAAPELLEACRYMHRLLTDMGHGGLAGAILGENAISKAERK